MSWARRYYLLFKSINKNQVSHADARSMAHERTAALLHDIGKTTVFAEYVDPILFQSILVRKLIQLASGFSLKRIGHLIAI